MIELPFVVEALLWVLLVWLCVCVASGVTALAVCWKEFLGGRE